MYVSMLRVAAEEAAGGTEADAVEVVPGAQQGAGDAAPNRDGASHQGERREYKQTNKTIKLCDIRNVVFCVWLSVFCVVFHILFAFA